MNEGRFNSDDNKNWQFDLVSELIWTEMLNVCNTVIPLDDLIADDAIQDIINQGTNIVIENLKEDHKRCLEEMKTQLSDDEYVEEETILTEEIVYY